MLLYFLFTDFRADKKLNVTSCSIDPFSILIFCSENFISPSSILMVYYSFEPFIASKIHGMGISKSHVRSKLFSLVCIMPYFIEIKFLHCKDGVWCYQKSTSERFMDYYFNEITFPILSIQH